MEETNMSAQVWLIFSAACVVLFALPSSLAFRIASYSALRGKKTAIATVSGASLGMVTAMTAAALVTFGLSYIPESIINIIQWAGTAWLMLFCLWALATPATRMSNADNDNLPARTMMATFVDCYSTALRPRYVAFFLALLVQFIGASLDVVETLAQMQALVLVLAITCALAQALFARSTMALARRMSGTKTARRARRTHFISGRAVSAGYRRIAA
jgi:threonine/homoserine/homoserine lactone efflux protein